MPNRDPLWIRLKRGDSTVVPDLLAQHVDAVWWGIQRSINGYGGADDVEDLVQETFILAWVHRDRFDPERGSLDRWIYSIAKRHAMAFVRKERRREALEKAHPHELAALAGTIEADPLLEVAVEELLQRVVEEFSPLERELLELLFLEGLTYAEVASRVGMPLSTVYSRVQTVRDHIGRLHA